MWELNRLHLLCYLFFAWCYVNFTFIDKVSDFEYFQFLRSVSPLAFKYFMKLRHILQLLLIWDKIRSLRRQVGWNMHFLNEMDIFWKSIFCDISDEIYCSLSTHIVLDYFAVLHTGFLRIVILNLWIPVLFVCIIGNDWVSIGYQSRGRIVFYFCFNKSMPITLYSVVEANHAQFIRVVPALDTAFSDEQGLWDFKIERDGHSAHIFLLLVSKEIWVLRLHQMTISVGCLWTSRIGFQNMSRL